MTNLWFLGTVYFQREDRIFSARGLYIFNIWGPYIFADRIFSAKWPYIFSDRTVYFQRLGTVYFRRPYILSRGPYIFSSRTVYFQPSGPYIFSLDRIFYVWPRLTKSALHLFKRNYSTVLLLDIWTSWWTVCFKTVAFALSWCRPESFYEVIIFIWIRYTHIASLDWSPINV